MIKVDRGTTETAGDPAELVAETALMLMSIYVIAKDELGEAGAREMIVDVGRVALADEMIARIETKRQHWKEKYEKGERG